MNLKPILILLVSLLIGANTFAQKTSIYCSEYSRITQIALNKLALELPLENNELSAFSKSNTSERQLVLLDIQQDSDWISRQELRIDEINAEGYQIINEDKRTYVIGGDERGLMYGIIDLRDQVKLKGVTYGFQEKTENPQFEFRAFKFNLPWSSYRIGEPIFQHMETVKDTVFWESFLDMMVNYRYNALTLWNLHPFTFMIQPEKYPEAIQFTGQEFKDWQNFWRTLFRMAKNRGIETYIINWNIVTSPGMTEAHNVANYKDDLEWHYGFTPADTSQIIIDYMRECITQTINEYPNLTGVGVSIGERMKMPMEDAMQWVKSTFVEGLKNANRKAKFIHRAPFKVEPEIAREYIESYTDIANPIIMEFKFNWSHGHSTPNLAITHGGQVADQYWNPLPSNYKMAWMMRNEDFIMLNWGNTEFIRKHMAVNSMNEYTAGYFVGSETYIPAREFRMSPEVEYNWKYAFEKDWEFLQMWGRLMYDPNLSDTYFIDQLNFRYGNEVGELLFKALQLGSQMPLELASFYKGTWDFTLYCEGFLNGKQLYRNYKEAGDAFIRVDEMINQRVLDPNYLNIDAYTNLLLKGEKIAEEKVTPLEIANKMEKNGKRILELCLNMKGKADKDKINFEIEFNDVKSWAHLSLYFADKLRGGMSLDQAIKTQNKTKQDEAITHLENAATHWLDLVESTKQYQDVSLLHIRNYKFTWKMYYPRVLKDIEIVESIELD